MLINVSRSQNAFKYTYHHLVTHVNHCPNSQCYGRKYNPLNVLYQHNEYDVHGVAAA